MQPEAAELSREKNGRRRRHADYISTRRMIYDTFLVVLLTAVPVLGMVFFGGVRVWSIGALMVLVYLASALFFLRPLFAKDLRRIQIPPAGLLSLVFFVYALLRIPFSSVPYAARIDVLKIGSFIAAYWVWSELSSRHKRWRVITAIVLFAGSVVAWYALIQHANGTRMVLTLVRPENYGMRASGTYICPNHFANMLQILICLSLAVMCMPGAGVPLRLLAGYSLLLFLPVLILTQSRSGWIGVAVGIAVTLWLIAWKRSRKLFYITLMVLPLVLGAFGLTVWSLSPVVRERLQGAMLSNPDGAVRARLLMWKDTIEMIKAKPLLGHGGGAHRWLYQHYKSHNLQFSFRYAHNEFLHLTGEYGIIGAILCAIILCWGVFRFLCLFAKAQRARDSYLIAGFLGALAACLAHACFDFNFHVFANTHMLILYAGLVTGVLYAGGQLDAKPIKTPVIYVLSIICVVWSLLFALMSMQAVTSYTLNRLADGHRKRFEMESAQKQYLVATKLDPGNWQPWVGLGNVYKTKCFWSHDQERKAVDATQSLAYFEKALSGNPYDTESMYGKSQVYASLGETDKSVAMLRDIVEFAPRELFFWTRLGVRLRRLGQYEEAMDVFKHAASFGVPNESIRMNMGILRKKLNEKQKAAL